jgi:predicted lipoprotein
MRGAHLRAISVALAAGLLLGACSDGGELGGDDTPSTRDVLTAIADGVIIPSYEALTANLAALDTTFGTLCTSPSNEGLEAVRAGWRDVELAWESTRATGVGPAIQQRAMGAIAFTVRPDKVEELLAGTGPVEPDGLAALGSDVRGIYGVELALFGPGSDLLATGRAARRCDYGRNAAALAATASRGVLDAWTGVAGTVDAYRDTFIAGMDGHPISSVEAVVNELAFRLQQADDQGVRALAAAADLDDLPAIRREGPAAYGIAGLRGILGGVAALVQGPDGEPGLASLVRVRSRDTARRLEALTRAAVDTLGALPDSSAAALDRHRAVVRAAHAVAALRVLVTTEVASQLGVTIGFSDSDGDS